MSAQEWAVRHPDGRITVKITGHPFESPEAAGSEAEGADWSAQNDGGCDDCGAETGKHAIVVRDVTRSPWRPA